MKQITFLNRMQLACLLQNIEKLSYKQFMLPILNYASSVCDPYHHGDVNNLKWFNIA